MSASEKILQAITVVFLFAYGIWLCWLTAELGNIIHDLQKKGIIDSPKNSESKGERIARQPPFKCPRCGGWAFGADLNDELEIVGYHCNSWYEGTPQSLELPDLLERRRAGLPVFCAWRGTYEECFDG